jgi:hypothetical protein
MKYMIDDDEFWRLFLVRLSCFTDPEHDAEMVQSVCEALQMPVEHVIAKMETHVIRTNRTRH